MASLLLGDPLPLLIMFIFDVEVTKILIQSFGLEHHLDFQNTIIASGKTDQKKKIIPGDNLWETSWEQYSISLLTMAPLTNWGKCNTIPLAPYKTFPLYLCVIMHEGSREERLADHLSNKITVSYWCIPPRYGPSSLSTTKNCCVWLVPILKFLVVVV